MGSNNKRHVAPASTITPSAAENPPAIGSTSYLLAVLAALLGFFFSQLQQLYIELNSLDDTHTSTTDAVQSHTAFDGPSGRGVASIVVNWEAERRLQKKQQEQEQEQNNHEPTDETVENISSIVKKYVDRNEPFVCRRCMMPESLGGWWDVDANLLEAIGADTVMPIRVAESSTNRNPTQFQRSAKSDAKHQTTDKSAYQEKNMTSSDFFSQYKDHSGLNNDDDEHWYAAQVDVVTTLPGLLKYIASSAAPKHQLMEAVGPTPSTSRHPVTLYFGAGERTTQLHYDSLENVVCLASGGTKTFALYDPVSSSKYLYIDRSVHGNFSPSNPSNPSPNHPMAKFALPSIVTLSVGDCLYLPVYWYHTVTSSDERTISINWWRSSNTQKMSILESIFCGRQDYGAGAKC